MSGWTRLTDGPFSAPRRLTDGLGDAGATARADAASADYDAWIVGDMSCAEFTERTLARMAAMAADSGETFTSPLRFWS